MGRYFISNSQHWLTIDILHLTSLLWIMIACNFILRHACCCATVMLFLDTYMERVRPLSTYRTDTWYCLLYLTHAHYRIRISRTHTTTKAIALYAGMRSSQIFVGMLLLYLMTRLFPRTENECVRTIVGMNHTLTRSWESNMPFFLPASMVIKGLVMQLNSQMHEVGS